MKITTKGNLDLDYYFHQIQKNGITELKKWPKSLNLDWFEGAHHPRTACIFMDIRKYSQMVSDDLQKTYQYLQLFYLNSWEVINRYGGYVEKQTGDGIMIVYPVDDDKDLAKPLELANAILDSTENNLNHYMKIKKQGEYIIGLGVDISEVIVTKVGLPRHEDHLMLIGNSANMAAKMSELTNREVFLGCTYKSMIEANKPNTCQFELATHLPYTIGDHCQGEDLNYNVFKFLGFIK